MNDVDYITRYWHYADAQEDILSDYIGVRQARLSDDLQDILDHFRNIQLSENISKAEVNRLHRKIGQWQKAGYDVGEFKLIMRDLDNRTRIRGLEALLAFLIAAFMGFYQPIMQKTRETLVDVSQEAYSRNFKAAQKVTGVGNPMPPTADTVAKWLEDPLPSGGVFNDDMYADVMYRARQFQKLINAEKQQMDGPGRLGQRRPLDIDNEQYKKALHIQRNWMLRRSQYGANKDNHAGQIDMYMTYVVSETVVQAFLDAGVKKYQFIATIDDRTTDACRSRHLKIYNMADIKIGINAPPIYPPYHPCRSIINAIA
ncbi:MAG TPA: hypothetical protein DEP23_04675 [Ruminococcaceae bacterium]|nr:hypothetical protein [Oscillospiraceae bacterium]